MLKLYNIYKNLILEAKGVIEDGEKIGGAPSVEQVMEVIRDHNYVNIWYGDEPNPRYCGVYNLGYTSNGNQAIRVWQIYGPGEIGWKTFIINKIQDWEKKNIKFYRPVSDVSGFDGQPYNPSGDETLSWGGSVTTSTFDKQN
jgi:hypothetical protein